MPVAHRHESRTGIPFGNCLGVYRTYDLRNKLEERRHKKKTLDTIRLTIEKYPDATSKQLVRHIQKEYDITVSPATLSRARKELGFR